MQKYSIAGKIQVAGHLAATLLWMLEFERPGV